MVRQIVPILLVHGGMVTILRVSAVQGCDLGKGGVKNTPHVSGILI